MTDSNWKIDGPRSSRAILLCAAAYALFGLGFLFGFGGIVAGFGGASQTVMNGLVYAGVGLAGLGVLSSIVSLVLAVIGLVKSGKLQPWAGLMVFNLGFVVLALILFALYAPRE